MVPTVHRATVCNPDIDLLCLSLRPFYLPREFGNIIVCAAYTSSANTTRAAGYITESIHDKLQCTPEALFFILGDFNHCKLKPVLPDFEHYVKYFTQNNKVLDKCYGNIQSAYTIPYSRSRYSVLNPNLQDSFEEL